MTGERPVSSAATATIDATAATEKPFLSVNNIEVIYNRVILVLKGVSLDVPNGGIVALLGANGAGKTTTLKAISNLLHAERGEVTKGAIMFDGAEVHNRSPNDLVAERKNAQAGYTSGGEQQMCAVGRALMSRPKMILLDEPSMGLAPQIVEEIFEIVKDLNEKEGVSFLLAEQNTNMALRFARYGYILENGRVVMDGNAKELSENEDVKEFYLGISGGRRKSFREGKHYRRRKRWLA
ncbi:MAG: ATP-binding cassette domain-containing protein [Rhizobiales bacterium]|nr:ATP-binding cassette domain-containing protein [Hyphomicrobiales bacterium]